ncbi:glycosyltransferase family 4 protein [Rhodopila sp.]|uniref:glycosyltransferase family 4 protein n=1 Tax=Rhodopila sp. TaxID=2480087 RepID=UPI003D10E933
MRILVHDYAGHPFQVHLSQRLAIRGHDVTHVYFSENPGPKADFKHMTDETHRLHIEGISIGRGYDKTSLIRRRFNDREYGRRVAAVIGSIRPDVVISGNTPTEAQSQILKICRTMQVRFVYWLQDFYSIAVTVLLRRKLGMLAAPISWLYRLLERRQLRNSDAVVAISDDFVPLAASWSGSRAKVTVIENWAAIGDFPFLPKVNAWSSEHEYQSSVNFTYSGTLGLKHKPELLVELAAQDWPDTSVVVVAEGVGADHLALARNARGLRGLKLLPLQPVEDLPQVLAASDVLVATIDSEAASFAVPSKVQSYLCAGRPILLAAPRGNLASRTVVRANAGIVVAPDDIRGFLAAAAKLRADPQLRAELGANGRAYAERVFNLDRIADTFEEVLSGAAGNNRSGKSRAAYGIGAIGTASTAPQMR